MVDRSLITLFGFTDELLVTIASLLLQHKKLTEPQRVATYQKQLRERIPQLREAVATEVIALYLDLANAAEEQIEVSYKQDIEASLGAMRQAQELQSSGSRHMNELSAVFNEVVQLTADTRGRLAELKQRLWQHNTDGTEEQS
jgi:spore cortex formation protein SpoVR/YcgB (stage V sporulation)